MRALFLCAARNPAGPTTVTSHDPRKAPHVLDRDTRAHHHYGRRSPPLTAANHAQPTLYSIGLRKKLGFATVALVFPYPFAPLCAPQCGPLSKWLLASDSPPGILALTAAS